MHAAPLDARLPELLAHQLARSYHLPEVASALTQALIGPGVQGRAYRGREERERLKKEAEEAEKRKQSHADANNQSLRIKCADHEQCALEHCWNE